VRDRVLEVRFVTGDGNIVRGGGPTVKNVTGYDLPRLLVGSLGTLGVIVQVTLRTLPRPESSSWSVSDATPAELRARLFRPACVAWDGTRTFVLLEGHPDDIASEQAHAGLEPLDAAPGGRPAMEHRGRASVRPGALAGLAGRLADVDCSWLAEGGVGTVHVSAPTESDLADARAAVEAEGGWLLREAGAPGLDPFGVGWPNVALSGRIKDAFDPAGKLNPGRLPLVRSAA
jgi:glycolate oxidase FAD binding subunit